MWKNVAFAAMCCLLVASCSSNGRKLLVQSDSFFVDGLEQSRVRNEVCSTCRSLGWNATLGADNRISASIAKGDVELFAVVSFEDDGTCTIDPVKISCSSSDEQRARRLFRRYIKRLRKYILRNTSAVSRKQFGSKKAITLSGGEGRQR